MAGTLLAESLGPNLGTTISLRLPIMAETAPQLAGALHD